MTDVELDRVHADLLLEEKRARSEHSKVKTLRDGMAHQLSTALQNPNLLRVSADGRLCGFRDNEPLPSEAALIEAVRKTNELEAILAGIEDRLRRFA